MAKIFNAMYPGMCGSCGDYIDPGDEVTYADDELVHADCAPEASAFDLG